MHIRWQSEFSEFIPGCLNRTFSRKQSIAFAQSARVNGMLMTRSIQISVREKITDFKLNKPSQNCYHCDALNLAVSFISTNNPLHQLTLSPNE